MTGQDIMLRGGGRLRADLFDDPFFFDLLGFNDGFNFTGMDFFEGFNVSGIVIEMPRQPRRQLQQCFIGWTDFGQRLSERIASVARRSTRY